MRICNLIGTDPETLDYRRRILRAVRDRFCGFSLYEAGRRNWFTKKEMRAHWKYGRVRGLPIIIDAIDD